MKVYASILLALGLFAPSDVWGFQAASVPKIQQQSSSALGATPGQKAGWDNMQRLSPFLRIEGESRKTWQFGDNNREVVQVVMRTEGRPMEAIAELWIGPDWTPATLKCYSEDGMARPIQTLIGTRNKEAQIEMRNVGGYELPFSGSCAYAEEPLATAREDVADNGQGKYVEGGAVYTLSFDSDVEQVQVLLNTDKRQLNARIELLNGPNNIKQQFEIFTNNGMLNSLFVVFNSPGGGNTVRVRNIAPLEFPLKAFISSA